MLAVASSALVVASQASAQPSPQPSRREVPRKYQKAASAAFEDALAADKRGDLGAAARHYERALELALHPNTAFNLADVLRRDEKLRAALPYYQLYLVLAPDASDRKKVEALIHELEAGPRKVTIRGERGMSLRSAYILIDGDIVHRPGAGDEATVELTAGDYNFDIVTATESRSERRSTGDLPTHVWNVKIPAMTDGNVVISSWTPGLVVRLRGQVTRDSKRLQLKPGTHDVRLMDRDCECPTVSLKVSARDTDVSYLYVAPAEALDVKPSAIPRPPRCRKLDIKQHTLVFD